MGEAAFFSFNSPALQKICKSGYFVSLYIKSSLEFGRNSNTRFLPLKSLKIPTEKKFLRSYD